MTDTPVLTIEGLHHVNVPVSDVPRSRDWYSRLFGLAPILEEEAEDAVVSSTLEHAASGLVLRLRLAPTRAQALAGFVTVALAVGSRDELARWHETARSTGAKCSPIRAAHLGWCFTVEDPDGMRVELRTREVVSADPY